MKTVILHGQSHEGSTCHIARMLAEKLGGEWQEFFLPRDFDIFCIGCTACFVRGEAHCPHADALRPITEAIDAADVIILASPVYVFHVTGAMKALLDHYGYRWMVHRPDGRMFGKQAVCISTAAGAGMKSTNRDMADSAFFWGCGRIYKLGFGVRTTRWQKVPPKTVRRIEQRTDRLARTIRGRCGSVRPALKTKALFLMMRLFLKQGGMSPADRSYWQAQGWLDKARPWK